MAVGRHGLRHQSKSWHHYGPGLPTSAHSPLLSPLQICLSPQDVNLSDSLYSLPLHTFSNHNWVFSPMFIPARADISGSPACWVGSCFLLPARAGDMWVFFSYSVLVYLLFLKKIRLNCRGCRDDSVVKRTCYSRGGPGSVPRPHVRRPTNIYNCSSIYNCYNTTFWSLLPL